MAKNNNFYSFQAGNEIYQFNGKNFKIYGLGSVSIDFQDIKLRKTNPSLRTLALTICNTCILACGYCYANKGKWDLPGKEMSEEIAFGSVDLLLNEAKVSNAGFITISLFGGEPCMRFDFIKKIVAYTKERAKDIRTRFALVTNGVLLDQEIISFLVNNKFIVSLSIDGTQSQHDFVRQFPSGEGSYDLILKNTKGLLGRCPVLVRATISDHNYDVCAAVKDIRSKGFDRIQYELDSNMDTENYKKFLSNSEMLFEWYLGEVLSGNYFDFRNITRVIASILLKLRAKSHCNAGVGYMAVSADGMLYPCHRFIGTGTSISEIAILQPLVLRESILDFDKQLKTGPAERMKECEICAFNYLCGGHCLYQAYTQTGSMFSFVKNGCETKKMFFDQALKMICILKGHKLKSYLEYLVDLWHNENGVGGLIPPNY